MDSHHSLLAFGETLFDVINGETFLGGAPFNVAAHFARPGNKAEIVSAVGNDDFGREILKKASQYNVGITYLKIHEEYPTGVVNVHVNGKGMPEYEIVENVAWDNIELSTDEVGHINSQSYDWVNFCKFRVLRLKLPIPLVQATVLQLPFSIHFLRGRM